MSVLKWEHTVPRAVMCKAVVISKGYTRKNRQMNKRMKKKCRCIFFHVSGMLISTQVDILVYVSGDVNKTSPVLGIDISKVLTI